MMYVQVFTSYLATIVSFLVTIKILQLVKINSSTISVLLLMILDVFSALLIILAIDIFEEGFIAISRAGGLPENFIWLYKSEIAHISWPYVIVFSFCVIPTIFHLCYLFFVLLSKLFQPIVKPLLMFLFYRFQESDKGILTQIAVGGGIFAELIHLLIRALTSPA